MALNTDPLVYWCREREAIRVKKESGTPKPWSSDPIFQTARFCNVRREDDRVTRWITEHWRTPHADDRDLSFAMTVARFVNLPAALSEIGFPLPWDGEHFLAVMRERKARGERQFGGAYMIRADAKDGRPTAEYQASAVFAPLWRDRKELRPRKGETLASYHRRLGAYHGMGDGFMPAQVVADMKFVPPLDAASDWFDFAVSGPGSWPGLNRVLGRQVKATWTEAAWRKEFDRLREAIMPELAKIELGDLSAQDFQNCLCEFAKFEHVRLGGAPKRRFDGAGLGGLFA